MCIRDRSKGAVVTMTMGVAREFAQQGIRALSISPGPVKTPFQDAASTTPELADLLRLAKALHRDVVDDLLFELVRFMCSVACSFLTSDTVYVNGAGHERAGVR